MLLTGKEFYDSIIKEKCGLDLVTIKEVSLEDYSLVEEELFNKYSINYDKIIRYSDDNELAPNYGSNSLEVKGWAIHYKHNCLTKHAVFIVSPPNYHGVRANRSDCDEILYPVLKAITLLHELGHIHDFQNEITMNHKDESVDLVKSEAYADIFALKRIKKFKHEPIGKFALSTYSEAIIERSKTSIFYKNVHSYIIKKIPNSKLQSWKN